MSMSGTPVDFDCVVVGAGVEGSAAAWALAKRHHKTLLLEQFSVGHSRGSSHGESRIIRRAYPADTPVYTHIMRDAFPLWLQLQQAARTTLFKRTGLLWMGLKRKREVRLGFEHMQRQGENVEWLDCAEVRRRFPQLRYDDDYEALMDHDAGTLAADKCVRALQDEFVRLGGTLVDRTLCSGVQVVDKQLITVSTAGNTYTTRRLLLCCGPWAGPFLDKHLGLKLPLQVQVLAPCYWRNGNGSHALSAGFPCLITESKDEKHHYGLPCDEYPGLFKFAAHVGYAAEPDARDRQQVDADASKQQQIDWCSAHIAKHLPDVEPVPSIVETCVYTVSATGHAYLGRHPLHDNVIIAAGFSGHGFKLAPVVGEVLADLVDNVPPKYDLQPFALPQDCCGKQHKL